MTRMFPVIALAALVLSCGRCPEPGAAVSTPAGDSGWFTDLQPVQGEFRVRTERPRLYLTPEELPALRERIGSTHRAAWEQVLAARQGDNLRDRMLAAAFISLVQGDPAAGREAAEAALQFTVEPLQDDLGDAYRVWPAAVVFDWCRDSFTEEQAARLLAQVRALLQYAQTPDLESQPPHAGHLVNHLADAYLPAGIAFYEMDSTIYQRALAVTRTQLTAKNIFYRYGASSQGNSYGVTHVNGDMRLLALLLKATGEDLFARFPFYRELGYYWIYTARPDGQYLRNGDDWLDSGRGSKVLGDSLPGEPAPFVPAGMERTWTNPWLAELLLYPAAVYRDPQLLNEYLKVRQLEQAWTAIEDILWRDPALATADPRELPALRWSGGPVGLLHFRTGWGQDDVVGMFKVMPLFAKNHDHLDRLSFQLYCRGALALDSGVYEGKNSSYDSDHWLNYFQRTIAHNTLLVRDPAEQAFYRGKQVKADGGQLYPRQGDNPMKLETIAEPDFTIARVLAAETDPEGTWAFVTADAAPGYGPKAELVERSFVFLRGQSDPSAALVILDRVVSRDPSFQKVWLLHSMEEPAVAGNAFTIRRGGEGAGGVLAGFTLLPEAAKIEKIGGPGYEFWVNDTNYATTKGGDAELGAWRLEVSPAQDGREALFLHALLIYPGEPATAPAAAMVSGPGLAGATVPGWTVVRALPGEAATLEYSCAAGEQLVFGLEPGKTVRVSLEGGELASLTVSGNGALRFRADSPGTIRLEYR